MKLFRPLLLMCCLAGAAISLASGFGTALAEAIAAPPHDLVTAIIVADVMRVVAVALAILLLCLTAFAVLIAVSNRHRERLLARRVGAQLAHLHARSLPD